MRNNASLSHIKKEQVNNDKKIAESFNINNNASSKKQRKTRNQF